MNILSNEPAMALLRETAKRLQDMGLECQLSPTDLREYGMTISLHVAPDLLGACAAHVAHGVGAEASQIKHERFAMDTADFAADIVLSKARWQL